LLRDFDPQGNASSGLGFTPDKFKHDIYDVIINDAGIDEAIVKTEIEGLDLVPARIELSAAEVELIQELSRETKLKKALSAVTDKYDYLLIDCPPSLGLLTVNALTAATSVLIPLQCEYYAMEGLSQLLNTIRLIKDNLNEALDIEGILLTMYDSRNNLSKEVLNQVVSHFPDKAFKTVVPRAVALSEAPSYGKPIIIYQARSKGSECYIELAKEILNKATGAHQAGING
ncbi:MAG: AAA family ATPase, partial [Mucispirillum sp.]|nr:AAA family ATPase [Mucispirillum sp.]